MQGRITDWQQKQNGIAAARGCKIAVWQLRYQNGGRLGRMLS